MRWRKCGLIYAPDGSLPWAKSHAMAPTPWLMEDGRIRLYLTCCDENMVGRVGYIDVDSENPKRILAVAREPVLDIGAPGAFDDNGVCTTCVVPVDNELRMYYAGFQLGVHVRYFIFTGLALSRNGGENFERYSQVPILDRCDGELVLRSAPHVLANGDRWRMWYISGTEFVPVDGKLLPTYDVRYVDSMDGLVWSHPGQPAVSLGDDHEFGLGRPFVVRDGDLYRMWYSSRRQGLGYRMGYAESLDGLTWRRCDHLVGLGVSAAGWDSQMVGYAALISAPKATYLFYNGNAYGATGVGYAILDAGDD